LPSFLIFVLDDLRFALPLAQLRETVRAVAITPLAGAPGVVEGVVNVRGTIMPVLDLRARFRLPPRQIALGDHLILATAGGRPVALRADRALDVQTLDDDDLTPASASEAAFAHLAGVGRLADGLVLVNDLDAFFTQGEAEALTGALASSASSSASSPAPAAG
jgi:purine-binding chemotaxis protein CheW